MSLKENSIFINTLNVCFDILYHIVIYLELKDISNLLLVNKQFYSYSFKEQLWKPLLSRYYKTIFPNNVSFNYFKSFVNALEKENNKMINQLNSYALSIKKGDQLLQFFTYENGFIDVLIKNQHGFFKQQYSLNESKEKSLLPYLGLVGRQHSENVINNRWIRNQCNNNNNSYSLYNVKPLSFHFNISFIKISKRWILYFYQSKYCLFNWITLKFINIAINYSFELLHQYQIYDDLIDNNVRFVFLFKIDSFIDEEKTNFIMMIFNIKSELIYHCTIPFLKRFITILTCIYIDKNFLRLILFEQESNVSRNIDDNHNYIVHNFFTNELADSFIMNNKITLNYFYNFFKLKILFISYYYFCNESIFIIIANMKIIYFFIRSENDIMEIEYTIDKNKMENTNTNLGHFLVMNTNNFDHRLEKCYSNFRFGHYKNYLFMWNKVTNQFKVIHIVDDYSKKMKTSLFSINDYIPNQQNYKYVDYDSLYPYNNNDFYDDFICHPCFIMLRMFPEYCFLISY